MDINNSRVDLFVTGSWEGSLSAHWGLTLTKLGWQVAATDSPLLFSQKANLTLSLWIDNRWFIEGRFLEGSATNRYRAGYQGKEDEVVQYVGIGNQGLDFPTFPFLEVGGNSASSFGAYGHFQWRNLHLHSLLRYDGAIRKEKWYEGRRELSEKTYGLDTMVRGRFFVLPDTNIEGIRVFIEEEKGTVQDTKGRSWRELKTTEYAASTTKGILELTTTPSRKVAILYATATSTTPWKNSLGIYEDTNTTSYLRRLQSYVNTAYSTGPLAPADMPPLLRNYPQCGQDEKKRGDTDNVPGSIILILNGQNTEALVIWERGTFSPFERLSRYALGSAESPPELVSASTGTARKDYTFESVETFDVLAATNSSSSRKETLYELIQAGISYDSREPATLWPLMGIAPEIYFPGYQTSPVDLAIQVRSYGTEGNFSIGTDVLPDSVQVYRNGILDSFATYDRETGIVTLGSPPGSQERIRITYLSRSAERTFGTLAAAIGLEYFPSDSFAIRAALGSRWNIHPSAYSSASETNEGTIGLSGELRWTSQEHRIQLAGAVGLTNTDTTGLYRILGMETAETIVEYDGYNEDDYFQSPTPVQKTDAMPAWLSSSSLEVATQAPLVYRNYTQISAIGLSTLTPIEWEGNQEVANTAGPYPVYDKNLDEPVLVAESTLTSSHYWTGFQVELGDKGSTLETAKTIKVPLYFYGSTPTQNLEVYLQLGDLTDKDELYPENAQFVVTKKLATFAVSGGTGTLSYPTSWTTLTVNLSDEDRRILQNARAFRILLIPATAPSSGESLSFRLVVGPLIIHGSSLRPIMGIKTTSGSESTITILSALDSASGGAAVVAAEVYDPSLKARVSSTIDRLHSEGSPQRVLHLQWGSLDSGPGPTGSYTFPGADGRVPLLPLQNYRSVSFFVKGPIATDTNQQNNFSSGTFHLLVGPGPEVVNSPRTAVLEVHVPLSAFSATQWQQILVRYQGDSPGVYVDGSKVETATIIFRPENLLTRTSGNEGSGTSTHYLLWYLEPPPSTTIPDGFITMDELCLEEALWAITGQLATQWSWSHKGIVLAAGSLSILENPSFNLIGQGNLTSSLEPSTTGGSTVFQGRGSVSFQVLGMDTNAWFRVRLTQQENFSGLIFGGGHTLGLPLGPLKIQNIFSYEPEEEAVEQAVTLSIPGLVPWSGEARVLRESLIQYRSWKSSVSHMRDPFKINLAVNARWTETSGGLSSIASYGSTWLESCASLIPDGGNTARLRNLMGNFSTGLSTKPLGVLLEGSFSSLSSQTLGTSHSSTNLRLELPLQYPSFRLHTTLERRFSWTVADAGPEITSDLLYAGEGLYQSAQLWSRLPLWNLGDPQTASSFQGLFSPSLLSTEISQALFIDSVETSVSLSPLASPWTLLRPTTTTIGIRRTLTQRLNTFSDHHQIRGNLQWTAANLFGAYGMVPLFSWYRDDSLNYGIEGSSTFVEYHIDTWSLSFFHQITLYDFQKNQGIIEGRVSVTSDSWTIYQSFSASRRGDKSLLATLYKEWQQQENPLGKAFPFIEESRQQNPLFTLQDSLSIKITQQNDTTSWTFSGSHESVVTVTGRFKVTAFGRIYLTSEGSAQTTTFSIEIGTTLKVQF
ncbi:MAG: LamG domain-containing protein [Treponemataceae bacterium]|nr:LamG domain-containing protein [Treponemataceae bacterium]